MAPRRVNQSAAEDIVFGNLGDDGRDDTIDDNGEGDDTGDDGVDGEDGEEGEEGEDGDAEGEEGDEGEEGEEFDDLSDDPQSRVSHTDQRRQQQNKPQQRFRLDPKGNVVDAAGNLIARAGKERRLWEDATRSKTVAQQLRTAVERGQAREQEIEGRLNKAIELGERLHEQYTQVASQGSMAQKAGLNEQEYGDAIRLAALSKTSPTEFLKEVLTRAVANGIDLKTLGLQSGGFDAGAMLRMIDERVKTAVQPMSELATTARTQRAEAERIEQARSDNLVKIERFFGRNPEAQQHLPVFEGLMKDKRFNNMSLEQMWDKIQLWQYRNRGRRPQQARRQDRGMPPTGRRSVSHTNGATSDFSSDIDKSYDTLLKEVFQTVRYN